MTTTPVRTRSSRLALSAALVVSGVAVVAGTAAAPRAGAATPVTTRASAIASGSAYASSHGYTVGIAVLDTTTGSIVGRNGNADRKFATESVVKTMIATRILLQGRMHGTTASRAYKMITQSDDTIASSLYGSVGGDGLITWIKKHYKIPNLGAQPARPGWWGNTTITPAGLVTFYGKIKKDRKVGPWLTNAMHHATTHGSDGVYQYFGIPSATTGAGIKQGWGADYDYAHPTADYNSTGLVNSDRYAVALLAMGPYRTYGKAIGDLLTQVAKRVLPGGRFPDPLPFVSTVSANHGGTAGGLRITVHGHDFTHVTGVYFGSQKGTSVHVLNSTTLTVLTPAHGVAIVHVSVATTHGASAHWRDFSFGAPPVVQVLSATTGPPAGGTEVTVHGTHLGRLSQVYFGRAVAKVVHATSTTVQVVAPMHATGRVDVRVRTIYALSAVTSTGSFTYAAAEPPQPPAPPSTTAVPPSTTAPASPSTTAPGGQAA